MPRLPAPSTLEHDFVINAITEHAVRVDGRQLLDSRALSVRFGDSYGSVEVSLGGETRVFVQVSADVVKPREERPYEGFVVIQTEISPIAGSNHEAGGRPGNEEVSISRALEKAIRRSEVVDRESLCIIAGQKVWQIRLDCHFVNDEGNLLDCASVGCIAALRHFRKPEVTIEGTEVTIHSVEERVPIPLSLHHSPYCVTFATFGSTIIIIDPSLLESQLCTGTLTLTLNPQNEICVLTKDGGEPVSVASIMKVIGIAKTRVAEIETIVKKALEKEKVKLESQMGY